MKTPNGVSGVFFNVGGNAATATQFYVTDSTRHFLRGALYFDTAPNEDSLKPVNVFLQEDVTHLINLFKWKPAAGTPSASAAPSHNGTGASGTTTRTDAITTTKPSPTTK